MNARCARLRGTSAPGPAQASAGPNWRAFSARRRDPFSQFFGLREQRHMDALRASALRHIAPDLFGRKGHDGRQQPNQRVIDPVQSGLRAPPGLCRPQRVKPILQHVEVDGAEVDGREIVHRAVHLVERELVVSARHLRTRSSARAGSTDRSPASRRPGPRPGRIEVATNCRARSGTCCEASGTPPTIASGCVRQPHVVGELDGSDPQAHDLGAVLLDDLFGLDRVAERFDIARPSASCVKPCVRHSRYGAEPFSPTPISSELWNQPRYWSPPSRYISLGQVRPFSAVSTARWLEPESNQTSRMSFSLRNSVPPHFGQCTSVPISSPDARTRRRAVRGTCRRHGAGLGSVIASLHRRNRKR